ncbi:DNA-processing protein DprA [Diaphorobacter aerolatus]|uniref:DNA-protecting protein DprA n=1 Tax=Diaphorobacter aerolatus TaxID=1288495 RepID=A0A7H0GGR6_9BURK|nr:DNA-processing protein DprA [Diaphorobacter aerolatus]QNP47482.1 DNA-protecting protein DprA [Diaphorobacter aerolatus]
MMRDELTAWLRLTATPGVGNLSSRRLLATFGMPQEIFAQPLVALQACVSGSQAQALTDTPDNLNKMVEQTVQWLDAPAANQNMPARAICTLGDPGYPEHLLATEDPPLLLYVEGARALLENGGLAAASKHCLAMVGSRNPTLQGRENARQFARALREAGLTIVSGLALGIDAAAHEGALAADARPSSAATIAVVGTGLDRVYPRSHQNLATRIAHSGILVSEYPLGTPPLAANFPRRNRIISGLSLGTLVVEAALASGSLITARLASEQGREVFAIPGSIHAPQSHGCHALLRQGAKLVESAQDVLEELLMPRPSGSDMPVDLDQYALVRTGTEHLSCEQHDLLGALGFDPVGLDALVARTGWDAATLQVQLLQLELDGHVARMPGGLYQRLASG